jgi:succinate dehydrogenase / fumarate reductase, iron-sulfur subunit
MEPEVVFRVRRSEPGQEARWEDHRVLLTPGLTVLDGLRRLKEGPTPSLAWRSSCRMGVCGSCGMMINGLPRLACNTQVATLGGPLVTVAPLPNFDVLRDLVPDLQPLFAAHAAVLPWLVRTDTVEQDHPTAEYRQTTEEMEQYLQFSYCIKCGCCMAACPTYGTDASYAGPMPLAQAWRYDADTRDGGFAARAALLSGPAGPWHCHYAGECARVCPKGADPARAIQLLRRELVKDALGLRRSAREATVAPRPATATPHPDVPNAPAPTVPEPELAGTATGRSRPDGRRA